MLESNGYSQPENKNIHCYSPSSSLTLRHTQVYPSNSDGQNAEQQV